MRTRIARVGVCEVFLAFLVSGCSHSTNWQQTYEGCKTLASAMTRDPDPTGILKPPDCEQIQQLCSSDSASTECRNELAKYSTK